MRSQIVLLSLLVGIATVAQPTALAESADACTQVGDKACELAEDAIAGDAEAMADLESFDRVKEILDREALAATPANDRTMFELSFEDSMWACEYVDSWNCPGGAYCSQGELCMPCPGCGIGGWSTCTGLCIWDD